MKSQINLTELEQCIGMDYHMKPEVYRDTERQRQCEQKQAYRELIRLTKKTDRKISRLEKNGFEFEF